MLIVLGFNIVYWGVTNVLFNVAGWSIGKWVEPTLVAAEIGLVIGTLVLASGALLQSRATGISNEVASRLEKWQKAQLRVAIALSKPHLDLQVADAGSTTQDTFTIPLDQWFLRLRLRNLGPGVALGVQLTAFDWWIDTGRLDEELAKLTVGGAFRGPILTVPAPMPRDIVNVSFAMKPDEEREFALQFRVPPPPEKMTTLLEQSVVIAWARDVEGEEVPMKRLGLRLQFAFPTPEKDAIGQPKRKTVWKWLSDDEVATILSLPSNRVSRKTGWWPKDPSS
jgi:hypothetical protein